MAQLHPTPVLTRDKPTEAERLDRPARPEHLVITLPDLGVEKMRGPKLVALWAVLIALSWAVAAGVGYAVYQAVSALF